MRAKPHQYRSTINPFKPTCLTQFVEAWPKPNPFQILSLFLSLLHQESPTQARLINIKSTILNTKISNHQTDKMGLDIWVNPTYLKHGVWLAWSLFLQDSPPKYQNIEWSLVSTSLVFHGVWFNTKKLNHQLIGIFFYKMFLHPRGRKTWSLVCIANPTCRKFLFMIVIETQIRKCCCMVLSF